MPQMQFPIFPTGVSYINSSLAFSRKDGVIYYFNGNMPVFHHEEDDIDSFRMITSQFYLNGVVTQSEIIEAFGVPSISVKRAVKIYRTEGPAGFYKEQKKGGGPRVLKADVIREVENLLGQGDDVKEIAAKLDIKLDTLQKAIRAGKVKKKIPVLNQF
jgi:Helix-turn-helix domain